MGHERAAGRVDGAMRGLGRGVAGREAEADEGEARRGGEDEARVGRDPRRELGGEGAVAADVRAAMDRLATELFPPEVHHRVIRDHGATMAAGNPTTINMLVNGDDTVTGRDLPSLRFVTSSSAPLSSIAD